MPAAEVVPDRMGDTRTISGRFGVWQRSSAVDGPFAAEVERLGYATLWLGGSPDGSLRVAEQALAATRSITVGTSIVNVWKDPADVVAASYHRLEDAWPGRFLLGLGIGHPEATAEYRSPLATLVDYLDRLDDLGVPRERRALAALGPKVLSLAAERTAGALPYLTTPEHTRIARETLGPHALLVAEQKVVLGDRPGPTEATRAIARPPVHTPYLGLTNYRTNLRRLGWADADLDDGGSDALIDALVVQGDAPALGAGLRSHLEAGADQVAVHALGDDPLAALRAVTGSVRAGAGSNQL